VDFSALKDFNMIHIWNSCDACGMKPIIGPRFECRSCPIGPHNDLCECCYNGYLKRAVTHPRPECEVVQPVAFPHIFRRIVGRAQPQYGISIDIHDSKLPAPSVPQMFVVRPEFRTVSESFFGSYAFVVDSQSGLGSLLLTGLHVLDALIKTFRLDCSLENIGYTGRELPNLIQDVVLYDALANNWMLAEIANAGPMLVFPGARIGYEEPYSNCDIAAFHIASLNNLSPNTLSRYSLSVGDPVWLVVRSKDPSNLAPIRAVVVERTEFSLVYRFPAGTILPRYCSGAPIVDASGKVAGINLGEGYFDGFIFGHANQAESIRRHLANVINAVD
jgi:hypothetical protein